MIHFVKLQEKFLKQVLAWRSSPEVGQWMSTDVNPNDWQAHLNWFKHVQQSPLHDYFVIHDNQEPIGVLGLDQINLTSRFCFNTYYLGNLQKHQHLGALIPLYFLNYIFTHLKLNKHIGNCFAHNQATLKLYQGIGYQVVGTLREHVLKNGKWIDIVYLEFTADDYKKRQAQYQRFEWTTTN